MLHRYPKLSKQLFKIFRSDSLLASRTPPKRDLFNPRSDKIWCLIFTEFDSQNNAWQLVEMNCDEDKCDDYEKPAEAFLQNIYSITQYIAR